MAKIHLIIHDKITSEKSTVPLAASAPKRSAIVIRTKHIAITIIKVLLTVRWTFSVKKNGSYYWCLGRLVLSKRKRLIQVKTLFNRSLLVRRMTNNGQILCMEWTGFYAKSLAHMHRHHFWSQNKHSFTCSGLSLGLTSQRVITANLSSWLIPTYQYFYLRLIPFNIHMLYFCYRIRKFVGINDGIKPQDL